MTKRIADDIKTKSPRLERLFNKNAAQRAQILKHPNLSLSFWLTNAGEDLGAALENPMIDIWILETPDVFFAGVRKAWTSWIDRAWVSMHVNARRRFTADLLELIRPIAEPYYSAAFVSFVVPYIRDLRAYCVGLVTDGDLARRLSVICKAVTIIKDEARAKGTYTKEFERATMYMELSQYLEPVFLVAREGAIKKDLEAGLLFFNVLKLVASSHAQAAALF